MTSKPSVSKYDDALILCRTVLRHRWAETDELPKAPVHYSSLYGVALICERCGMRKVVFIGRSGSIESRRYSSPAGYRLPGVNPRQFRQELLRRRKAQTRREAA